MRHARYDVVTVDHAGRGFEGGRVVIRDLGPWDRYPTVTNDAEWVVQDLVENGIVHPGMRLLCYDSDGQLDELCIVQERFAGFAPGP